MAIITISRGSYSKGKEVAEGVAARLGFECVSRDILLEASDQFNVPEIMLLHAIQDAPSILDRFSHGKIAYITYIQSALLEHVKRGNVVYHGLAGHILLKGMERVLKVRIIADPALRVAVVMERERVDEKEARRRIAKDRRGEEEVDAKALRSRPLGPVPVRPGDLHRQDQGRGCDSSDL